MLGIGYERDHIRRSEFCVGGVIGGDNRKVVRSRRLLDLLAKAGGSEGQEHAIVIRSVTRKQKTRIVGGVVGAEKGVGAARGRKPAIDEGHRDGDARIGFVASYAGLPVRAYRGIEERVSAVER